MKRAPLPLSPSAIVLCGCAAFLGGCVAESTAPEDGGGTGKPAPEEPQPEGLPILGWYSHDAANVDVSVIATAEEGLNSPRDLAFNPLNPDELWVVNHADDSMVVLSMSGGAAQKYNSFGSDHFLSKPAAIAFSDNGNFATAQEEDQITQPTTPAEFMGPTLWTSDRGIFDGGHGGHLDMLHNSPNAVGMAWESGNAFWVLDGYHRAVTRYDFQSDHGPGGADHTDGIVTRYAEGMFGHSPTVSSHMQFDHATNRLYIADHANGRIAVVDTTTGTTGAAITPNFDGSQQTHMLDASVTTLIGDAAEIGLWNPSGLDLHDGYIFVTDNPTATVFAFTMDGTLVDWLHLGTTEWSLQGITFDAQGSLYAIDTLTSSVLKISAKDKPAAKGS